jgi:hypothetical protein
MPDATARARSSQSSATRQTPRHGTKRGEKLTIRSLSGAPWSSFFGERVCRKVQTAGPLLISSPIHKAGGAKAATPPFCQKKKKQPVLSASPLRIFSPVTVQSRLRLPSGQNKSRQIGKRRAGFMARPSGRTTHAKRGDAACELCCILPRNNVPANLDFPLVMDRGVTTDRPAARNRG